MNDIRRDEHRAVGHEPDAWRDPNPDETREWLESLDAVISREGLERARRLLGSLQRHADRRGVPLPMPITDDLNTIPSDQEPPYPGDEEIERNIRSFVRWNAAVMVSRANVGDLGLGGHISTYASAATLYEVGFQHFFRGHDDAGHGDQIFVQGHASPGIYARAFLEGRLSEAELDAFRQEVLPAADGRRGLSSYPHPRLMPGFWEFPTVSMGLGALNAIYQARFNHYLMHRGLADTSRSRVWCFLGDGEMDEPEAQGALTVASRDRLDNLIFVVNCNLQRLDGPVRGNGKIVQELEGLFRGAGWRVLKVMWGREWDDLLEPEPDPELRERLNEIPDGQLQTYAAESGAFFREDFFHTERLRRLVEHLSDEDLARLARSRGGHDPRKVYAAYARALEGDGRPTVILAHTIKGWALGPEFEARNATHQMKKLTHVNARLLQERLHIELPEEHKDDEVPPYVRPPDDSPEIAYLLERRQALGGFLPERRARPRHIPLPSREVYEELKRGSGSTKVATTMAFVRLLRNLARHSALGPRIVPIIPDEARTFGLDAFFPTLKIYSPYGQRYDSVDRDLLLAYTESEKGQLLHEGITEAGSMGSFHAVGSSYATFGEPMLPFFIFYSMFGFQRVGDLIWSAMDQRARGFLLGATAGRTTLNGEGLQHEDGHSLLIASAFPAVVSYDPSFAFEIPVIVEEGVRRMVGDEPDDVIYYITMYNEPVVQPPAPSDLDERAVLKGLYRYRPAEGGRFKGAVLASGSAMSLALEAQRLLLDEWDVGVSLWSAPSWTELRRDALACERHNRLHPTEAPRSPWVQEALSGEEGPFVAVSDWVTDVPAQICPWVPGPYAVLGTNGFGRSDTRPMLRRLFQIDKESIAVGVLYELARMGRIEMRVVEDAIRRYGIDPALTVDLP